MNQKPLAVALGLPKDYTIMENGEQLEVDAATAFNLVSRGLIYDQGENAGANLFHIVDLHDWAAVETAIAEFVAPQHATAGGNTLRDIALRMAPTGYRAMGPGVDGGEIVFVSETEPHYFSLWQVNRVYGGEMVTRLETYIGGRQRGKCSLSQPMDDDRPMEKAVRLGIEDALYEIALTKTRLSRPMAAAPAAHMLAAQ